MKRMKTDMQRRSHGLGLLAGAIHQAPIEASVEVSYVDGIVECQ